MTILCNISLLLCTLCCIDVDTWCICNILCQNKSLKMLTKMSKNKLKNNNYFLLYIILGRVDDEI